ncbi:MAG: helix-turn-helix transcriptional regulator [Victivallales bacterium]|nr:helix-turn-helix transcriptional regulator [Victivallales bacterium]MBT7161132.1 helix-turn-helix transcriptional regulator [Victivallales bacterium]MBT7299631.1 helix-turn-helix transcriptional regulator [Victivallales bacterium]
MAPQSPTQPGAAAVAVECLGRALPQIDLVEYRRRQPQTFIRAHAHPGLYQLDHYVLGEGVFTVGEVRAAIDRRTFFLASPGQTHEIRGTQAAPLEKLTTKFRFPELPPGVLPSAVRLPAKDALRAIDLFRQVVAEGVLGTPERTVTATLRLSELLLLILGAWSHDQLADEKHPAVAAAKRFMSRQFGDSLSLEDVAQVADVSPEHLCRLFRKHAHSTPLGYLRQLRVERAKAMLATSKGCLRDIATAAGFSTAKDMNRAFQKLIGVSPRAHRRSVSES